MHVSQADSWFKIGESGFEDELTWEDIGSGIV